MTFSVARLIFLSFVLSVFVPFQTLAAGIAVFTLSPTSSSVIVGERLTVDIEVHPNGESLDTVRSFLSFPPQLLKIEEITLHDLFSRSSPGNSFDNVQGTMSYGGFNLDHVVTESGVFATVTFSALTAGEAKIQVLDTSRLIFNGEEKANPSGHGSTVVMIIPAKAQESSVSILVESLNHPNQETWSKDNDIVFTWHGNDFLPVGYSVTLDHDPQTEPSGEFVMQTSQSYSDVTDGIWYFHVQGISDDGFKTDTVHYQVKIDSHIPNVVSPTLERIRYIEGETALLTFGTTDDDSGIDHYEVSVNQSAYEQKKSPIVISDLKVGDYLAEVKAVDRAGNERYGKIGFRVYPKGTILPPEDKPSVREQSLTSQVTESVSFFKNHLRLLITVVLAALLIFGIIGTILFRRRKSRS
ncbi:MAG: hypothetical protein UU48_C0003G0002 [Candidatus Uhrbacteria bacterium GW2011_GWF2_41_16]|uniref:Cohesin domain-containing protein n=2 Tax=Candidatus Uhriibacteriota TaxID=1752732 RepID=A0A0G0VFA4_9BACT|nr:MAG: hypothetical protein UU35_C0003G0002 [Candidatus Uhrbacteria bacterium GW2011_GWC2_41_11]KKR98331.1 MAG: hypothetical protein UU48_C0003G0002 [Candidatus Uhrbacteria bacterium GW2011_GWF2_41_16]HBP00054.1 hypothetical protein [Candidatus Uhrbacteria bacterium]